MGAITNIEWCDHTFNAWRGCTKVSDGCKFCYAERQSKRNPKTLGIWGDNGSRVVGSESYWAQPLTWERWALEAGDRARVFAMSLADVFEKRDELRAPRLRLFDLIRRTPHLDWLLLSKRPENTRDLVTQAALDCRRSDETCEMLNAWLGGNPPPNVWLGTSVENHKVLQRIEDLRDMPAVVRFLSIEPLLGPIPIRLDLKGIQWVIIGGESGPGARACYTNWIDDIVSECRRQDVAVFVKQLGANHRCIDDELGDIPIKLKDHKGGNIEEFPADLRIRQFPVPCGYPVDE